MPKGIPIGFQMAEKNDNKQTNRQTDRHFRIYISRDGFAIIPHLRQTGIAENLATFGKKNSMNFSVCPVNLFAKRIRFLSPLVFL